jgi:hypothetical protein
VKKYAASALAVGALALIGITAPADAAPQKAEVTCSTCVAPITCAVEDQCVLDFVGNNGAGYWRARQENGTVWVRLTLVNGQ